jgi:hypothetical protein
MNIKLFTFQDKQKIDALTPKMSHLLGKFFSLITLPIEFAGRVAMNSQTRQHFDTQLYLLREYFLTLQSYNDHTDPRAAALVFATRPNDSFLLEEEPSKYFQHLLRETDISMCWDDLLGALIWCLIIGSRCSALNRPRKWLLVQATHIVWPLAVNKPEDVLKRFRLALKGLDDMKQWIWGEEH